MYVYIRVGADAGGDLGFLDAEKLGERRGCRGRGRRPAGVDDPGPQRGHGVGGLPADAAAAGRTMWSAGRSDDTASSRVAPFGSGGGGGAPGDGGGELLADLGEASFVFFSGEPAGRLEGWAGEVGAAVGSRGGVRGPRASSAKNAAMVGNLWPRIMALDGVELFGGGDLADLGGPDFDGGVVPFAGRETTAQDEPMTVRASVWVTTGLLAGRRPAQSGEPAGSRLVTGGGSL